MLHWPCVSNRVRPTLTVCPRIVYNPRWHLSSIPYTHRVSSNRVRPSVTPFLHSLHPPCVLESCTTLGDTFPPFLTPTVCPRIVYDPRWHLSSIPYTHRVSSNRVRPSVTPSLHSLHWPCVLESCTTLGDTFPPFLSNSCFPRHTGGGSLHPSRVPTASIWPCPRASSL